jgi:hypothetical protein
MTCARLKGICVCLEFDMKMRLTAGEMCSLTSIASPPRLFPPWSQRVFGIRLTICIVRRHWFRLLISRRSITLGPLRLIRISHVFDEHVVLVSVIKVEFVWRCGIICQDSIQGGSHYLYDNRRRLSWMLHPHNGDNLHGAWHELAEELRWVTVRTPQDRNFLAGLALTAGPVKRT